MSDKILEQVTKLNEKADAIDSQVKAVASRRNAGVLGKAPAAITGESIMSSRGFSFGKLFGCIGRNGSIQKDECKIELDFIDRFSRKVYGAGYRPATNNSYLVPIAPDFFPHDVIDNTMYHEMKGLLQAGVMGADQDETWANRMGRKAAVSPAQSWVDQSVGGSFVPPATFGPPIELLRNNEAVLSAGATIVPLGPTGKIIFPRLNAPTQAQFSAENNQINPNVAQTGQLELSAKKVMGTVVLPGELLRFGSPATEAIIRNDLFKSVSLVADKDFLEGPGSSNRPLGLATMAFALGNPYGCSSVTPTNANQLAPQDVYAFLSAIEENNGNATAWIMRPKMAYAFYQARWTPYSTGTSQGGFVFELVRGTENEMRPYLAGLKVTRSTQVSQLRGTGVQTYVLALNAPDIYVGMFGAIEFSSTDAGWTLLSSDQVAVRALLSCDIGARHPAQVCGCDALNFVVAG